jgi:PIN domain nuclease of toxin-antitoxin system
VLDASALIAYARHEAGFEMVAARLRSGARILISAVNWAEAVGKLREYDITAALLRQALEAVGADIAAFTEADADAVGDLTPAFRTLGLSLGDRACIALGVANQAPALTADGVWARIDLPVLMVELIR